MHPHMNPKTPPGVSKINIAIYISTYSYHIMLLFLLRFIMVFIPICCYRTPYTLRETINPQPCPAIPHPAQPHTLYSETGILKYKKQDITILFMNVCSRNMGSHSKRASHSPPTVILYLTVSHTPIIDWLSMNTKPIGKLWFYYSPPTIFVRVGTRY